MMNKLLCSAGLALGLIVAFTAPTAEVRAQTSTTTFTASYMGAGSSSNNCTTKYSISGVMPTGSGPYPVFLYQVGTTETYTNASAMAAVNGMAQRGYIAATIQYNSGSFGNCAAIQAKEVCIFNPNSSTSAISALCGMSQANCSHGLVTAGFSQGAVIATQAKNTDSAVVAAYGMGDGVMYTSAYNLTSCQANGNRTLPSTRLRIVNGVNDQYTGSTQSAQQTNMQSMTGFTCASGSDSCLQSSDPGSPGWVIATTTDTGTGSADHCYMRDGSCSSSQNSLSSNWQNSTTDPFALNPNLNFLQVFVNDTN
jgi:hypothetical protein